MSEPGWYPDPIGAAWARYWTGSHWSSRVTDFDGNESRLGTGLETVPPPWGGSRWDYKVLNVGELQSESLLEESLVELGRDGWDLIQFAEKPSASGSGTERVLILKRKLPPARKGASPRARPRTAGIAGR